MGTEGIASFGAAPAGGELDGRVNTMPARAEVAASSRSVGP